MDTFKGIPPPSDPQRINRLVKYPCVYGGLLSNWLNHSRSALRHPGRGFGRPIRSVTLWFITSPSTRISLKESSSSDLICYKERARLCTSPNYEVKQGQWFSPLGTLGTFASFSWDLIWRPTDLNTSGLSFRGNWPSSRWSSSEASYHRTYVKFVPFWGFHCIIRLIRVGHYDLQVTSIYSLCYEWSYVGWLS